MFQSTARRSFCTLVLAGVLSACQSLPSTKPTPADAQGWQSDIGFFDAEQRKAQARVKWRYAAKVGLTTPELRETANIVWEYTDQANIVRLFGPLGIGAVRLQFDQYGVVLSDNKGVLHRGESAEALLTKIVGWPIPIDALSKWLFVLPAENGVARYRLDDNNAVSELEQLGWNIKYSGYKAYDNKVLPRKIVATKDLGQNQLVTVKLITKNWQWQ